jgi:signal peptidase I
LKYLAFDNTWYVIALIWALLMVRVIVPRVASLRPWRASTLEIVDSLLVAVLLVFLILRPFVVQAFYIPSGSMEPTLRGDDAGVPGGINDRILVNKFIYFFREPQRGDIVVFVSPPNADPEQKDFIKRVVGLPGDHLMVHGGHLWRNGVPLSEPYIAAPLVYDWPDEGPDFVVQPGTIFVMGDNRNASNDSHVWGALPRQNLLGKAFCIFWPISRARLLR